MATLEEGNEWHKWEFIRMESKNGLLKFLEDLL